MPDRAQAYHLRIRQAPTPTPRRRACSVPQCVPSKRSTLWGVTSSQRSLGSRALIDARGGRRLSKRSRTPLGYVNSGARPSGRCAVVRPVASLVEAEADPRDT